MYLSKIHIPWHQAQNPYQLHQALWRLFPGFEDADREFLFRVEQLQKGIGAQVLMQSAMQPQSSEQSPAITGSARIRFECSKRPTLALQVTRQSH